MDNKELGILRALAMGSEDDERFKLNVGDKVRVTKTAGGSLEGNIAIITFRRNAYPPPMWNTWMPIYFIEHIDGTEGGGDIGENCLELIEKGYILDLE